jgi:signal peptidase II
MMTDNQDYLPKYVLKPAVVWFLLVFLDQLTKYVVRSRFSLGETAGLTSFFQLTYLTNSGIAFSMFQGSNIVFAIFTVLVLAGFTAWYLINARGLSFVARAAFVLVAAGAFGNLIDRVLFGHVTDFLDFYAGNYHWPSFNVADSCISTGGTLLFIWALMPVKE